MKKARASGERRLIREGKPRKKEIVAIEALAGFLLRPLDLRLLEFRGNQSYDAAGNPVLQIEHVFQGAVEFVRPSMPVVCSFDQLLAQAVVQSRLQRGS